ncbi:MAG: LysM peptidoglycan-binding domain-containing protein [Solirubrobacterales bacterium]|nr:LysM peptidoglycan-binding domain-containing protein [Solirubrobacterales bacterium]
MRVHSAVLLVSVLGLVAPGAASADFVHVVAPGETLSSVAAADGLSVAQLAAANGISPTAQLISGSGIQIPPQGSSSVPAQSSGQILPQGSSVSSPQASAEGDGDADGDDGVAAAPASSASAAAGGGSYVVQPGDTLSAIAARAGVTVDQLAAANGLNPNGVLLAGSVLRQSPAAPVNSATANVSGGSYVVQPGDTLSAIAARAGVSIAQLAADNGLDPNGVLLAGSVLRLSGGGTTFVSGTQSTATAADQPVGPAAEGSAVNPPYPTPQMLSAGQIGSIAQANGVSPSLADAIAWQESGFNNDLVSTADARGIMQILPGTWEWIQNDLNPGGPPLAPASANDNVRGGVLMLRSLLDSTGGDPAMAAAGYYQGLPSVQQNGVYPSTQQYVNSVMALRQQFGGG